MKIKDVLEYKGSDIKTVSPAARLELIAQLIARLRIASVVVIDANRCPLGIITERRIVGDIAGFGKEALELTAADMMEVTGPVCSPDDDLRHAMSVMMRQRIRHLLVEKDGDMCGIVSIGDLVQAHIRDTEMENQVLRDMAQARLSAA